MAQGDWMTSGCGGPAYRILESGEIEIQGEGAPRQKLPPDVAQWMPLLRQAEADYDMPAHYLGGIMSLESAGKPYANKGPAYGLMALIPITAESMAGRYVSPDELSNNFSLNVSLGAKYARDLWDRYEGDPIKVAFGYNAGSARCGAGKYRQADGTKVPCPPNRFGLVADCVPRNGVLETVDYGGIVARYANEALHTIAPWTGGGGTPIPEGSSGSLVRRFFSGWPLALGVLFGVAAGVGVVLNEGRR